MKKIASLFGVAALATLAACPGGTDDTRVVEQDTVMTTVPGVDTVQRPVQVQTQDTVAVERQVEVHTDTVIDTR
jgi:hypothetical protein